MISFNGALIMAAVVGVILLALRKTPTLPAAVVSVADQVVKNFARGIATAEGFFLAGSRAARNNNPGNLTKDLLGRSVGKDGMFIVYGSAADGWADLEQQVRLMMTNKSAIYNSSMSILEVATRYTTTQQGEWAANVSRVLGVEPSTRLRELTA